MADTWDDSDVSDALRVARQPSNLVTENDVASSGDQMRSAGAGLRQYFQSLPAAAYQNMQRSQTVSPAQLVRARYTAQGRDEALRNVAGSVGESLKGQYHDIVEPAGQVYRGELSPEEQQAAAIKMALGLMGMGYGTSALAGEAGQGAGNVLRMGAGPVEKTVKAPNIRNMTTGDITSAEVSNLSEIPANLTHKPPQNRNTQIFPQLQERYPLIAPPVEAVDKISGKPYLAKQLSDEALLVQKARVAAQKDIDEGNYSPYFKLSERADVNPADYPEHNFETTQIVKQRPETIEKYEALAHDPEGLGKLTQGYQRGLEQKESSENWYFMKQLQDEFVKEYGPEQGKALFKERFADPMAATTGGADPTSNLMMAHYGNYLKNKGLTQIPPSYEMPFPIGGRYVTGNMEQYRKMIMENAGIDPIANPKRYNFSGNFLGKKGATLDEQMSGAWDPKMGMPPTGSYGHYESALADEAIKQGVDPRYFQEVAWAGLKDAKTKGGFKAQPMIGIVNEAIERTSRLTGMSPAEVVRRGLVRSEIPLYGMMGAAGAGAMYGGQDGQPTTYAHGGSIVDHALNLSRRYGDTYES